MSNNFPLKNYLMILISAIGFGSYGVWSRLLGNNFDTFSAVWIRSALVLFFLIPIAFITKSFKKIEKSDIKWFLFLGLFSAITQAPLYYAYNHMDIGTATLILYSAYIVTSYTIGGVFLKEKIGYVKVISLVLALVGLLTIFGFSLLKFSILAILMAILNGVASSGNVVLTKKCTNKFSSIQVNVYIWLAIFLTHLPLAFIFKEKHIAIDLNGAWLNILVYALVGLVSYLLLVEGFKKVDASIGSLIGLMEIIFGIVFGMIIFREQLTLLMIIGGILIIIAAMLPDLINLIKKKKFI